MNALLETRGPWSIPIAVHGALCSDGRRRYAYIGGRQPDTYFSIPAAVTVCRAGKRFRVSGYITGTENPTGDPDYEFRAYTYGKNGNLLP